MTINYILLLIRARIRTRIRVFRVENEVLPYFSERFPYPYLAGVAFPPFGPGLPPLGGISFT